MADEEAFTAMFRLHYPRVLAFVSRRTDQARAHDVVAETFATAWRHFGRLPAEPLPWLYRVARNSLANEERSARRQARLAERIGRRGVETAPDHAVSVVTDVGLREALDRLSPTDREALLLIGWEDLDHDDAARCWGARRWRSRSGCTGPANGWPGCSRRPTGTAGPAAPPRSRSAGPCTAEGRPGMTAEQDAMDRLAAANPVHELPLPRGRCSSNGRCWPGRGRNAAWSGTTRLAGSRRRGRHRDRGGEPPGAASAAGPGAGPGPAADHPDRRRAAGRGAPRRGRFMHVTGTTGRVVHVDAAGGYDLIRVDSVQSVQPADGLPGEGWLAIGESGSSVRPLSAADAAAYARDGSLAERVPGAARRCTRTWPATATIRATCRATGGPGCRRRRTAGLVVPGGHEAADTFTAVVSGGDRAKIFGCWRAGRGADPGRRGGSAGPARARLVLHRADHPVRADRLAGLLGAGSDRITYTQAVVRQPGPANASLTPGAVQYSTAVTSVTWSDRP